MDINGVLFNNPINDLVQNRAVKLFPHDKEITYQMCDIAAFTIFNKIALDNLNHILDYYPDMKIVLCTAWRTKGDVSFLRELFRENYFSGRILDKIDNKINKGSGVTKWLSEHPDVIKYVILDDYEYDFHDHKQNLIAPDSCKLLTAAEAQLAINMLQ